MKKQTLFIVVMAIGVAFIVLTSFTGCYEDKTEIFYDGEGNELPTEAVTALVRSQYVLTNKTEDSLINKYFK